MLRTLSRSRALSAMRPTMNMHLPRLAAPAVAQRCCAGTAAGGTMDSSTGEAASEASSHHSDQQMRMMLLEAAMAEVPTHGWTTGALTAAALTCGLSPMAHGLLPRGPVELVEHFSNSCDARLASELGARAHELVGLEVHNRLIVAMQTRLRMVAPHAATWPQALALRALPANLTNTLRDGHALASLLLELCGDDAKAPLMPTLIDHNMKTLSIGAIYGAAELHLLTDSSEDHGETWLFVEREVDALRTMATAKSNLPDLSPAGILLSLLARK